MSPADAIALYRHERTLSERRNRRRRMIDQAVLAHKWQQLEKRRVNPFRNYRTPTSTPDACTSRRRWNANGQLTRRDER